MAKRQCGTCQWFESFGLNNKLGHCRCLPPTNTDCSPKNAKNWADGENSVQWPTVPRISWCGQWKAKGKVRRAE